jgi:hypothetical protein
LETREETDPLRSVTPGNPIMQKLVLHTLAKRWLNDTGRASTGSAFCTVNVSRKRWNRTRDNIAGLVAIIQKK